MTPAAAAWRALPGWLLSDDEVAVAHRFVTDGQLEYAMEDQASAA